MKTRTGPPDSGVSIVGSSIFNDTVRIMEQPQLSFEQHQAAGSKYGALGFAVLTMSDSRTRETDTSGQFIREAVAAAGHKVVFLLPGSTKAVRLGIEKLILPQAGHLYFELQK